MSVAKKVKKTPNIEFCLKKLKEALDNPADENLKKEALDAHEYLTDSFNGTRQPMGGGECPADIKIMHPIGS